MALPDLKSQRGIVDCVTRIRTAAGTNRIIVHAPPTAATIADNESLTDIVRANCEGINANRLKYATGSDPTLNITIGQKTPDVIAMGKNREMVTAAAQPVDYFRNYFRVPDVANPTVPAEAAGVYGQLLAADAPAEAAHIDDKFGTSRALTQEPFASIDPATDLLSFAIGDGGEFKFSNDLRGLTVAISETTFTATEIWRMATKYSSCSMKLRVVQQDLTVAQYIFPQLVPIVQDITIEAPDQQLSFTIAEAFRYEVIGLTNACLGS
jgi:hypothetical protein